MNTLRWIVLLPLLGAVVNGLLGAVIQKSLGKRVVTAIGCVPVLGAFVLSLWTLRDLLLLAPEQRLLLDHVFAWIHIGSLKVDVAFQADPLSAVMILVVTGVGGLIHLYSIGYMDEDRSYWRYFAYLNLFMFAMLTLVLADNLLLMFVGWEGVGLCSYALIGFWYEDRANTTAGNKAFLVNRIGDFGFILGTFLLFWSLAAVGHPTLTFRDIALHAHLLGGQTFLGYGTVTVITLLLFVGATGKSAQIPLYVWLPDAMAGPTPVSALIHAATMVTAGVYMIGRLNFLYSMAPVTLNVVATVGALTAFFAATIGTAQNDIKKVLAYSTVSQLGYMFLAMGSAAYAAGIFHLMTHAFFKACLFLGAGSVIHALHHEQDMRRMGGLWRHLPLTYATFVASTLAIAGIPPTAGFFSKDEILWDAFASGHGVLWLLGLAAAGLTAFYMGRQVLMTFHGECRVDPEVREHLHESPAVMTIPLVVLGTLAVVGGFVTVGNRFEGWLEPVLGVGATAAAGAEGATSMEWVLMALSVLVAAGGFTLAYLMYGVKVIAPERVSALWRGRLYRWVYAKYYVDEFYQVVFVDGLLRLTRLSARFDVRVIDGIVNGTARLVTGLSWLNGLADHYIVDGAVDAVASCVRFVGGRVRRLQTGSVNAYLYVVLIGVLGVMLMRLL